MPKSTILVESITRERLKRIGRKGESYDHLINQLLLQKKKADSLDDRISSLQSSLDVVLFDNDTINVRNDEKAMIIGELHVVQQRGNSKRVTYLFANGLEYEKTQSENTVITEEDLCKLDELSKQPDYITRLIDMIAPTVIGHEDKKLGIILMYIGAHETKDFRGRIHSLFIGPPGTAKSKLAQAAKRLGQPHSRYSSTQGASGKSITAIIDKDNDSYVLRNGVLPQAKKSVCILNEVGSLSIEDQRHLFDIMEEGKFTLDKYGFHKEIDSPTTILGTTNPGSGEWYADIADKGQIPLRKELVDRYDLIFVFDSLKEKNQRVDYAKKKFAILKNKEVKEDHELLRKIIEHAKSFNPQLSEEAEAMIIDYWSGLDLKIFPTNRVFETIVRVSIAFGRLHFSNLVTSEIAKEAIEFLTRMYRAFDRSVVVVQDPRDATCQEIVKFLTQNPNIPFEFQDCINYAASNNTLVESYVGKSPVNNNSSKYRDIADRFKQGLVGQDLITIEDLHPLTLVYRKNSDSGITTGNGVNSDNGHGDNGSNPTSEPSLTSSVSTTIVHTQSDMMSATREKVVSSINNNSEISTGAGNTTTTNIQCKEDNGLAGIPEIPCIFCRSYRTQIEFDLALHLQEHHKMDLVKKLHMGKGYHSIEERADYAVELGKEERRS